MRKTSIAVLALAVLAPAPASSEDGLSLRIAIMRLANEGMRLRAGQALHVSRHAEPAPTAEALVAEGAVSAEPEGSAIVRTGEGGRVPWRLVGERGGTPEIPIMADGLDGTVCREAARLAGPSAPFGCAAASDGVVFRYRG